MHRRVQLMVLAHVAAALLLPLAGRVALAQSASCSIWVGSDFWEPSYQLCGGPGGTEFQVDRTATIFAPAHSFTQTAPGGGLCSASNPLTVFPAGVYGRQTVRMTITMPTNPEFTAVTCEAELIHSRAAAAELVLGLARGDAPPQMRVELATELIVRESTAPPATTDAA